MSRQTIDDYENWGELLIWENMKQTWDRLPEETKDKIREFGNAPSWDKKGEVRAQTKRTPEQVREDVIKRDYEILKALNTGSKKKRKK